MSERVDLLEELWKQARKWATGRPSSNMSDDERALLRAILDLETIR